MMELRMDSKHTPPITLSNKIVFGIHAMYANIEARKFSVRKKPPTMKETMVAENTAECHVINAPRLEQMLWD